MLWSYLGNAYRVKGDSERAIECFDAALRIQPHPDFYLNLGGVRFVLGELDEAVRLFYLGLDMNPRHVLLQFSLGNALALQGKREEAIQRLEDTLRIQPDFTAADQYLRNLQHELRDSEWRNWRVWAGVALFAAFLAGAQRVLSSWLLRKGSTHQETRAAAAAAGTGGAVGSAAGAARSGSYSARTQPAARGPVRRR